MTDSVEARDLVIGFITDYGLDQVLPWAMSLEESGFRGEKAMIVYNAEFALVDELAARGFRVIAFEKDDVTRRFTFGDSEGEQILVSRFFHIWCLLAEQSDDAFRYVISADVKDVVFQQNPSRWLEAHLGDKQLNVGSESVRFADEPWGNGVMANAFEEPVSRYMQPKTIYNAGTIAGKSAAMRDFALQVYLVAAGRPDSPDQASANLLWSLEPFRSITRFNSSEDGWACQAGTSMAASYVTGQKLPLIEPAPIFDGEAVLTSEGRRFCLVHQYDRVPELRAAFSTRYSGRSRQISGDAKRGQVIMRPDWRLKRNR